MPPTLKELLEQIAYQSIGYGTVKAGENKNLGIDDYDKKFVGEQVIDTILAIDKLYKSAVPKKRKTSSDTPEQISYNSIEDIENREFNQAIDLALANMEKVKEDK